jgi:hypothetical protein
MNENDSVYFDPNEFKFYYLSYRVGSSAIGAMVIRQKKAAKEDGFNIAAATELLVKKFDAGCVITFYVEVSHVRYAEWNLFLQRQIQMKPNLTPIEGGNESKSSRSLADLKLIQDIELEN